MKIGIIGFGQIGRTLAAKLSAAGFAVKVASSRDPASFADDARAIGARAVGVAEAAAGVDAVIFALPLAAIVEVAPQVAGARAETVFIDTSNYYPFRDGVIAALEGGPPQAVWVSKQLGRPVIKAWNAVLGHTLADRGRPAGLSGRIAVPVSGDDPKAKALAGKLVDASGFDAVDTGPLSESWRQEPGNPAYCTELGAAALRAALAAANRSEAPRRRDEVLKTLGARETPPSHDEIVAANRAIAAKT